MRFKFCGDLDCPDWILAEIATLSRITSVKIKLLSTQVLKDILGNNIDYGKVSKLTADAKYDIGDIKAAIAALAFIFMSAVKFNVEEETLSNELQQLGLPREHSIALCKVYADNSNELYKELKKRSLKLSHLEDMQWRVDYLISSSHLKEINEPVLQLLLKIRNPDVTTPELQALTISSDKARVLLYELKQAYNLMQDLA